MAERIEIKGIQQQASADIDMLVKLLRRLQSRIVTAPEEYPLDQARFVNGQVSRFQSTMNNLLDAQGLPDAGQESPGLTDLFRKEPANTATDQEGIGGFGFGDKGTNPQSAGGHY